ncbi:hypothetical protein FHS44_004568 [Streptosporangium saharense]|uniref:Uncharacterized protein n=1 Tax=Streptosporangium saharense TaxID=1706840 RepID=A0A7W7VPN4_9ACTN|nr:hypothetical protein [Streptosporangium saharense]
MVLDGPIPAVAWESGMNPTALDHRTSTRKAAHPDAD